MLASPMIGLEKYLQTIIAEVCRVLTAEHCDTFFVNEVRREIWCVGMPDQEMARIPWETGSLGEAAQYGRILNLSSDDFDSDDFSAEAEKLPGPPRCVLIVPVKHMNADKLHTIGIIRAVNKSGSNSFEDFDVTELTKIAMLCADSFYRQSWAALFRMSSWGDQQATSVIASVTDLDHYNAAMSPARLKSWAENNNNNNEARSPGRRKKAGTDQEGSALSSTAHPHAVGNADKEELNSAPELHSQRLAMIASKLASLEFCALDQDPVGLVHLVPRVMQELECCARCNVKLQQVIRWAEATRGLYHDQPFHNWFHGFSVFQMCYYQLRWTDMADSLRAVDVFGLLIASLCHDVDHPAVNNAYLIATESELALRYNDVSVLENHHASLACQLMKNPATTIVDGLEQHERSALRKVVIASILATDMSQHAEICKKLLSCEQHLSRSDPSGSNCVSPEGRQMLLCNAIHAADLSAQTLPWEIARQWEERISREFVNQAEVELGLGMTPAPFMHFDVEDLQQRGKLQCDFIDFVLVPLWEPYTQVFPTLRQCFDGLLNNRKLYEHRKLHGCDDEARVEARTNKEVAVSFNLEAEEEGVPAPQKEREAEALLVSAPPSQSPASPQKPPGDPPRLDPPTLQMPPAGEQTDAQTEQQDAGSTDEPDVPSTPESPGRRSPEIDDVHDPNPLREAADTATGNPDKLRCPALPSDLDVAITVS